MITYVIRLAAALALFASPSAMASVIVNPSLFYYSNVSSLGENDELTQTALGLQLHAGFRLDFGLTLGVNYFTIKESQKHEEVTTDESSYTPTGIGLSVGYLTGKDNHNFALNVHYYLQAETVADNNGAETKLHGGTGIGFDLAYYFALSNSIHLGPKLSYTKFDYKKADMDGLPDTVDLGEGAAAGDWSNTWTTIGASILFRF